METEVRVSVTKRQTVVVTNEAVSFPDHWLCCNLHSLAFSTTVSEITSVFPASVHTFVTACCKSLEIFIFFYFFASLGKKQSWAMRCSSVLESETHLEWIKSAVKDVSKAVCLSPCYGVQHICCFLSASIHLCSSNSSQGLNIIFPLQLNQM